MTTWVQRSHRPKASPDFLYCQLLELSCDPFRRHQGGSHWVPTVSAEADRRKWFHVEGAGLSVVGVSAPRKPNASRSAILPVNSNRTLTHASAILVNWFLSQGSRSIARARRQVVVGVLGANMTAEHVCPFLDGKDLLPMSCAGAFSQLDTPYLLNRLFTD